MKILCNEKQIIMKKRKKTVISNFLASGLWLSVCVWAHTEAHTHLHTHSPLHTHTYIQTHNVSLQVKVMFWELIRLWFKIIPLWGKHFENWCLELFLLLCDFNAKMKCLLPTIETGIAIAFKIKKYTFKTHFAFFQMKSFWSLKNPIVKNIHRNNWWKWNGF